jgi:hypothetical protein
MTINDQPGTAAIAITETTALGTDAPVQRFGSVNASKFPKEFSLSQLIAVPLEVPYGGGTTLSWAGTPDATYTLSYDPGSGMLHVPVTATGPFPTAGLVAPTVFTLEASVQVAGQDHPLTVQRQVSVTLQPQLSITFFTTSATAFAAGHSLQLMWHTVLATGCSISVQGLAGSVAVSATGGCNISSPRGDSLVFTASDGSALGTIDVPDTATAVTFVLAASGAGQNVEADMHVQLLHAHIDVFEGRVLYHTGRSTLHWSTSNAVEVTLSFGESVRAVPATGSAAFFDGGSGRYALQCRGFGGVQNATVQTHFLAVDDAIPS